MLGKIADFYEQEVDAAIANLLTLMEPDEAEEAAPDEAAKDETPADEAAPE